MSDRDKSLPYASRAVTTADIDAFRGEVLAAVAEAIAPSQRPHVDASAAMTRRVRRYRVGVGALITLATALVVALSHLWTYLTAVADQQAQERSQALEDSTAAKALADRVEANTTRLEAIATPEDLSALELKIDRMSRRSALQWNYFLDVIDSLKDSRRCPPAPPKALDEDRRWSDP